MLSIAFIQQVGANDVSEIFQNSTGNIAQTFQQGTALGNVALIDQGFTAGGDSNFAESVQLGDDNFSEIEQNLGAAGGSNSAIVLQENDSNSSSILQDGTGNSANVSQFDGSTSVVSQVGDGNSITVIQGTP